MAKLNLTNLVDELKKKFQTGVQNVRQNYASNFNPMTTIRGVANQTAPFRARVASNPTLNRFVEGDINRITLPRPQVKNQFGQTLLNIGMGVPESIINTPRNLIVGPLRVANEINTAKSQKRPLNWGNIAGGVAPYAEGALDVASFGGTRIVKDLLKGGIKEIGKQGLKKTLLKGATTGAKYGGFGGLTYGIDEQYKQKFDAGKLAGNVVAGTALGGVLGGAISGSGALLGSVKNAFRKLRPKASEKEITIVAGRFLKDEFGQMAGSLPKKRTKFIKDAQITDIERIRIRKELGLPTTGITSENIPLGMGIKAITPEQRLKLNNDTKAELYDINTLRRILSRNGNRMSTQQANRLSNIVYGLRNYEGNVSNLIKPNDKVFIDKILQNPDLTQFSIGGNKIIDITTNKPLGESVDGTGKGVSQISNISNKAEMKTGVGASVDFNKHDTSIAQREAQNNFLKDLNTLKSTKFDFKTGDSVIDLDGRRFIVKSGYIDNGIPKYEVYTPGKKNVASYQFIIRASELKPSVAQRPLNVKTQAGKGVKLNPQPKVATQLPQKVQLESNMQQPTPQGSAASLRKNQGLPTSTDIIAPKSKPYIEGKIVKSEREAIGEWDRAIQDYANGIKRTKRGVSFEPSQKKIVESQEKARIKTEMDEYKQWSKQVFGEANARTETKAIDDLTKQMKTSTNQSVLDTADNWKDKPRMSYGRETMERNFEDIMGADAPLMKSKLLEPVYKANADIARFKNKERAEIKALGIKPRSEESRLVQELGEGKLTIDEVRKLPNGEKIIHAESVLRQKYDQYLEQLNKVLVRNGYDPIPKRKDYFHHFEDLNGLFEQVGVSIKANDLPTDINGLTADFKPGRTFFSATLQRKGTDTAVDAITGIDKYLDGAANQIYHTDNIQRLRAFETAIREKYAGTKHLTNFAADLDEYINALAGKKSMVDRGAENFVGRTIYSGANLLKKQVGANMVGANISSAITNSIPITQTLATTNKISVGQAMLNIIKNVFKDDGFIDSSNFLTSRIGSDRLSINNWEKIQKGAGWLFKIMDNFTSQLAVRSKYLEGIGKGLSESEAMRLADAWGRKTLAGRSAGEMPTMFDPKTLGFITQFQLEVNNQLSFIGKDIPRNFSKAGAASAMAQLFVYSYIYNNLYEKAFGRRPAFDPIGVAQQTYEDYTNPDMKKGQATTNLLKNVSNQLPFVGMVTGGRLPIGSAVPDFAKLAQGETTWGKELKKPLFYLFPPTGGGQIKKSTEGVGAYSKGYSETDKGNIRYPVPQTATNLIRTAIAGQYSTPEARKYFREGETPMGEVQSQVIKASPDKTEIYNQFMSNRDETSLVNKVKEQIKGGKDITEKAEPTVYTMDGVETQGFKIGNKFVYVDEDGEATSKSISTIEKAQKSYDKGLIDAQYSLSADRLKRADDDAGWVDLTQQYVDYLTEYKTTLNEKTDAKDILTVENKIEDLQASIDKIKKGKKPKKITFKVTKYKSPTINLKKSAATKLPTIKFAKPKITKTKIVRKYNLKA
jgi:hypothetical protein